MAHKEQHLAELLKLPPEDRLEAANTLFDSLDDEGEDAGWEQAWTDELRVRLEGLRDGSRQAVDADAVFAEARAHRRSSDS